MSSLMEDADYIADSIQKLFVNKHALHIVAEIEDITVYVLECWPGFSLCILCSALEQTQSLNHQPPKANSPPFRCNS